MKPNRNLGVFKLQGIRAILFDKDGTLLDFAKTWRPVLGKIKEDILDRCNLSQDEIKEFHDILGVTTHGFTSDSVFVKDGLEAIVTTFMKKSSLSHERKISLLAKIQAFMEEQGMSYIQPFPFEGVKETLDILKQQGFILGVVTSDLDYITRGQLKEVGLAEYFDFIGADDGERALKPDPELLHSFCKEFNLEEHEVAMVGDTINDIDFAKNNGMGYAVYVRSGYPSLLAEKSADMILENMVQLVFSP